MERVEGKFLSGFVPVVGRPNVGKSTLLNRILGEKVSIVSDKPQTTRNRICGVLTEKTHQVVFLDTPGIHRARDEINRYMVDVAVSTFSEADLILFLVEPDPTLGKGDQFIWRMLRNVRVPVFVLVNKMDGVPREQWEERVRRCRERFAGKEVFPISARTGEGLGELMAGVLRRLPEGPLYFPPDLFTDQPLRQLSSEIIREKVFQLTGEEVPYSVAIEVVSFEEKPGEPQGLVSIEADVHVERDSQKGILIGKGGQMLKRIGSEARRELESLLGAKVFLRLWVKVTKGWKNDPRSRRRFGYG